ncbi:MAG TPA: ABC transporter ATP-binding protein [Desulfatirhabdiaceae bacterium]|nr:ABC transporter ATP-binding protein [Desulfatirhabdiaceae bacterium]
MLLEVIGIHTYYDLSHILFDITLSVDSGEIVCLLGRNGAGKSTTMKSIIGLTPPKTGSIRFRGTECMGKKPYKLVRMGIGYVPDDRRVFADLTVSENLEIVGRKALKSGPWNQDAVYDFFPALRKIDSRRAGFLSGGEQQMLTIGRALMTNPDLLLLDEPTEGLAPLVVRMLEEQIRELKHRGMTILLAEQNQKTALSLSDRAYVIDNGMIRYHGTIDDLTGNDSIRQKYLCL